MSGLDELLTTTRPFLTDGGFETTMVFLEGLDLPLFSAAVLLEEDRGREAMERYWDHYLRLAAEAGTGFVLDTNTWRGGTYWSEGLGRSDAEMIALNHEAVVFANGLRDKWAGRGAIGPILVNGVVGPAGDGYAPEFVHTPEGAQAIHTPQIQAFAEAGVDFVSAITLTHVGEAVGIARAARDAGLPVVISFTVETDGKLPTGQTLGEAIAETDAATGWAPIYYMVNCAHPDHFSGALAEGEAWLQRIGGVRANASRMSHEELDNSETLDDGDPKEFGHLHLEIAEALPNLRVLGGCCGTDHRHVGHLSHHFHFRQIEAA